MQGLPAGTYVDAARATLESAQIFARSWQFVCHVADLPAPGTAARFDCAGRSAVVLRTRAGELRGFHNACRHRGTRLVEGDPYTGLAFCVDGHMRCPYHGWTYDETGALTGMPGAQRYAAFDAAAHGLRGIEVTQWHGLVFVAFEPPVQSLASILASAAGDWPDLSPMRRLVEPGVTSCAADWKLACEHLLDTAHVDISRPLRKPRLFEPAAFERRDGEALRASAGFATGVADSWSARVYRQLMRDRLPSPVRAESVFVWPNLLLQLAPDGLAALQVLPGPTGHCSLRESRYATPDPSRESKLLRYLHQRVRRQARAADVRILERVQQGLANLATGETWSVADSEAGVGWFVAHCAARCAGPTERRGTSTTRNRGSRKAPPPPVA